MAIVKKIPSGWMVVSERTGLPLIQRIFNSKGAAKAAASRISPGFY